MREKYAVGQRVEFMTRAPKITLNGNVISNNGYRHLVGYIKRIDTTFRGLRYIICDASKDSERFVYKVKARDIFGLVEKKEKGDKK